MSTAAPPLFELQMQLRRAVFGGDAAIVAAIRDDGLDPAARLAIYRNHAVATLRASLQGIFSVVCRLVDERFFAYAATEYIRQRPPRCRRLAEYGADFADFLADFEPCKALPYLPDVARFEWAVNRAGGLREMAPLPPQALAAVPAPTAAWIALRLQPSLSYLHSPWPIDAIWQANRQEEAAAVDLAKGDGAMLQIRRAGDAVAWRRLAPAPFAFRAALAAGRLLGAAIAAATRADPAFDHAGMLQRIFADGLVVACCLSPGHGAPQ
jgi:hypothetical protein